MHSTLTCIVLSIVFLIIGLIVGLIIGWILAPDERSIYLKSRSEPLPVIPPPPEEVSIIVNAQLVKTSLKEISYDDIVSLARKKPRGARAGQVMSVTYCVRRVAGSDAEPRLGTERSGMMHPGCKPVRLEAGMIFNVMDTSNA